MNQAGLDPRQNRLPLGIGKVFAETLSIVRHNISTISVLVFVPILLLVLIEFLMGMGGYTPETEAASLFENGSFLWKNIVSWMFTNSFGVTVYACLVKFVYDTKLGRPAGLANSVSAALQVFIPLAVCDFIATLLALLGMMAFVLPGLYLFALWSVVIPSVVLEEAGFHSFARSASLTSGYRWVIVVAVAILLALQWGLGLAIDQQFGDLMTSDSSLNVAAYLLIDAAVTSFFIALGATFFTLIYLRLREIKEGTAWLAGVVD